MLVCFSFIWWLFSTGKSSLPPLFFSLFPLFYPIPVFAFFSNLVSFHLRVVYHLPIAHFPLSLAFVFYIAFGLYDAWYADMLLSWDGFFKGLYSSMPLSCTFSEMGEPFFV